MPSIGILLGLTAALLQSAAYFFSRRYVIRRGGAWVDLLILSHVLMGVASLALLPLISPRDWPPLRTFFWPLAVTAGFYVVGQLALLVLMRRMEASRIAPLLSLKIVILAAVAAFLPRQALTPGQWAAVGLCVGAAWLIHLSGPAFTASSALWLFAACLGYSLSDLGIAALVRALAPLSAVHAAAVGACLAYLLCGVAAVPFLFLLRKRGGWHDWPDALPYAAAWFLAMIVLFGCFGTVGPVYGNILQSTRGILTVCIGAALARWGWVHIEGRVPRGVLIRRLAAAVLMSLAIALFQMARPVP